MVKDKTIGATIFTAANYTILTLLMILTLYPCIYVLFASFSDPVELYRASKLLLYPQGFSLEGYQIVLRNPWIWRSYLITIFYVTAGGLISVSLTLLGGYTLSRRYLPGRFAVLLFITITMFFSGGLVPTFLLIQGLGLTNTVFAMLLPGAISTYNLIVMKTFLQHIPDEMEESARIDGAHDFTILIRIIIPLATPVIAVISLFYMVSIWNSYIPPTIYLRNRSLFPLQVILREILLAGDSNLNFGDTGGNEDMQAYIEAVKYSTIVVTTVPILCVYPFLQRFFVKGVMLGAIKG